MHAHMEHLAEHKEQQAHAPHPGTEGYDNLPSFLQSFLCLSAEPSVAKNSTRSFLWQRQRSTRWNSAANFHVGSR